MGYLRGKNKITKQNNDIYDEKGTVIKNVANKIKNFWTEIYTKNKNNSTEKWANTKEKYEKNLENEYIEIENKKIHHTLQEHFDMAYEINDENKYIKPMENPKIVEKELKEQIKKMKNKKKNSPAPKKKKKKKKKS